MRRYIAFLRGINVGGHTVKMEKLRSLFAELGFASVATFIASGNVIFEAQSEDIRGLERQIERHLRQALGYDVATLLRSAPELVAAATYEAFPSADLVLPDSSLYVAFLREALPPEVWENVLALCTPVDNFHSHEREIYWLCRTRLSESPVFARGLFEKTVNAPVTMRNITTVRKLAAKYGGNTDDA